MTEPAEALDIKISLPLLTSTDITDEASAAALFGDDSEEELAAEFEWESDGGADQ